MDPIISQPQEQLPVPDRRHFLNKKFVVTFVILLLLGSGAYAGIWLWQNHQVAQEVVPTVTPRVIDETADWKTYTNTQYGFEFKYPNDFSIKENINGASITHGIPYEHNDTCDMKGDSQPLTEVVDFNTTWKMFNGNMESTVAKDYFYPKDVFENGQFKLSPGFVDEYSSGGLNGYRITMGVEGCGRNTYYFSIDNNHTLVIEQPFNAERTPLIIEYQKILSLPGVITPEEEGKIFDLMLATFKFTDSIDTSTWKTYTNTQYGFEFRYPENLKLTETSSKTNLNHSVPYKNSGECDMMGDSTIYNDLTDFNLSFEVITKINLPFKDGEYSNGELKGEWVLDGAEGCGTSSYYFPYGSKTLVIKRDNVQILSGIRNNAEERKEILSIPGAISREQNQILFNQILSTFKFTQ